MIYEHFNEKGELIVISKRPQALGNERMGYVAHLLLGVKKGWAHADNLALRHWNVQPVESLKPWQLTSVINELMAQNKDAGKPL